MRILSALTVALAVAIAGPAFAQSFDCNKAASADERAICGSGELSALDDEMSALYKDVRAKALMGVAGEELDAQRTFLAERNACGPDVGCISNLYKARIAELKSQREALGEGAAN